MTPPPPQPLWACLQVPVAAVQSSYNKDDFFDQLSCDTLERMAISDGGEPCRARCGGAGRGARSAGRARARAGRAPPARGAAPGPPAAPWGPSWWQPHPFGSGSAHMVSAHPGGGRYPHRRRRRAGWPPVLGPQASTANHC